MATVERIEPAYVPWSPSASGFATEDADEYVGRHRAPGRMMRFAVRKLFYLARHARR
jgi:hypothetical protein